METHESSALTTEKAAEILHEMAVNRPISLIQTAAGATETGDDMEHLQPKKKRKSVPPRRALNKEAVLREQDSLPDSDDAAEEVMERVRRISRVGEESQEGDSEEMRRMVEHAVVESQRISELMEEESEQVSWRMVEEAAAEDSQVMEMRMVQDAAAAESQVVGMRRMVENASVEVMVKPGRRLGERSKRRKNKAVVKNPAEMSTETEDEVEREWQGESTNDAAQNTYT